MKAGRIALAVVAVLAVAGVTAAIVFGALGGAPPTPSGAPARSAESTRTLVSAETTPGPGVDTAAAAGLLGPVAPRPRDLTPVERRKFDAAAAVAHVRALEAFGVRAGGSAAEAQGAEYLRGQLAALGLDARIEEFGLPNGTTSRNVVARVPGSSARMLVLGAHMDSKPPSPGANDNGSGCGALLEIAGILASDPVVPTVEIVFYGSEEIIGGNPDAHHFGSRYRVSQMSAAERANCAGMISVDMIGYGTAFHSRAAGTAPLTISDMVLARAKALGYSMTFKKDTSSYGISDHEAYERVGIPATVVCWRTDPVYHTAEDVSGHLSSARIQAAGAVVLDFARNLDESDLEALTAR